MDAKGYIQITSPAPILNTPDFCGAFGGPGGCEIFTQHLEFIAFPGEQFVIKNIYPRHHHCIYQISTDRYVKDELYLDSRFAKPATREGDQTNARFERETLKSKMQALLGVDYIWGGNWSQGIYQMLHLYPPQKALSQELINAWVLKGVDCSGLLYEVTEGKTPRNTRQLLYFGKSVAIQGKSVEQTASLLMPMDMVVWPGHVWFMFDTHSSIESKSPFGVIKRPLKERLEETLRERSPVDVWSESLDPNRHFTVRRFCN